MEGRSHASICRHTREDLLEWADIYDAARSIVKHDRHTFEASRGPLQSTQSCKHASTSRRANRSASHQRDYVCSIGRERRTLKRLSLRYGEPVSRGRGCGRRCRCILRRFGARSVSRHLPAEASPFLTEPVLLGSYRRDLTSSCFPWIISRVSNIYMVV